MKILKKIIVMCAVMSLMSSYSAKSFAAGIAVVDPNKIKENYNAAQEIAADLKVKESELQKFITDAQKQIQNAKTPLEKDNLSKKLEQQFEIKRNVYAKDQIEQWNVIEANVIKTIKEVSALNKYDMVLNKEVVIDGGCDITDEVLKKLNKQVSSSASVKK